MVEPIISVSGLRGIVGQSLDPAIVIRYVAAFLNELPSGAIVVSFDGRTTGPMLKDAVRSVIAASGREVLDAGIAATPTVGVLVRQAQAVGGVQISASHNPPEYNGLKLFAPDGRVVDAEFGHRVLRGYRAPSMSWASYDRVTRSTTMSDTHSTHLSAILATVDVERIRGCRFRVFLDSNHGAGSLMGRLLLDTLGCQTVVLEDEHPDGRFAHPTEPTEANLASVLQLVTANRAAVGFCQDPDADRLAVIDERGRYIGEEYTLALCLDHVLRKRKGVVVANCATSRMSQDIAERHGSTYVRAAVGEANVTAAMTANSAIFGGEGNGGPIDPRVGYVRDSFVGMALILDAMAASGNSVADLANGLPRYEIHKTKFPLNAERTDNVMESLETKFSDATADRMDGMRFDWDDRRWLLVRQSNTEPIIRAIAEAPTRQQAVELCRAAEAVIIETGSA